MPLYDFKCEMCGQVEEFVVTIANCDKPQACKYCQQNVMVRQFPVEAIRGLQIWEPHYNEMFDCDVNSKGEYNAILKDKDCVEAGDRVRGGRDFDPKADNFAPIHAPTGKRYTDRVTQRLELAEGRARDKASMPVGVDTGDGYKEV